MQKQVPMIRTPHIVNMEKKKGAFVSPSPLKIPSRMIRIANNGSETATIFKR